MQLLSSTIEDYYLRSLNDWHLTLCAIQSLPTYAPSNKYFSNTLQLNNTYATRPCDSSFHVHTDSYQKRFSHTYGSEKIDFSYLYFPDTLSSIANEIFTHNSRVKGFFSILLASTRLHFFLQDERNITSKSEIFFIFFFFFWKKKHTSLLSS